MCNIKKERGGREEERERKKKGREKRKEEREKGKRVKGNDHRSFIHIPTWQ